MSESDKVSKSTRCSHPDCKKKLGLLGFECRCKNQFCAAHRAAEAHNCSFDFKTEGKKELLRYMSSPIIGPKLTAI